MGANRATSGQRGAPQPKVVVATTSAVAGDRLELTLAVLFDGPMVIEGEYVPSARGWVRRQVEQIEAQGTTRAVDIMGMPVILLTMRGISGKVRKVPLMRVEHDGVYAAVGSRGGAPEHPKWVANLRANPVVDIQDAEATWTVRGREIEGDERTEWWELCVAAYPPYAEYQEKTDRLIPVFVLESVDDSMAL